MKEVHIKLTEQEIRNCKEAMLLRYEQNKGVKDNPAYDRTRLIDDTDAGLRSYLCECAVAKFLDRYWFPEVWNRGDHDKNRHRPDVSKYIDVKWIRDRKNGPTIQKKDKGRIIVGCHTGEELCDVTIAGYTFAAQLSAYRERNDNGSTYWCCSKEQLKPANKKLILLTEAFITEQEELRGR